MAVLTSPSTPIQRSRYSVSKMDRYVTTAPADAATIVAGFDLTIKHAHFQEMATCHFCNSASEIIQVENKDVFDMYADVDMP